MKDLLKISLIQFSPEWEDKQKNMRMAEKLFEKLPFAQDIVIFPEMFLTGFSMNIEAVSEPMEGEMVKWMKNKAKELNITIVGSLPIIENSLCYNRLLVVSPNNKIVWYNKRHLFRMGEEHTHYSAGNTKIIFEIDEWALMPLVCYDLRFPVWSRNENLKYNMLLYVANWPAARNDAFLTLLKARAIENSSYVIGVNRVGTDGNNIKYIGNSVVFDAKGHVVAGMVESEEIIINFQLSMNELKMYREKFPVHLDADDFEMK